MELRKLFDHRHHRVSRKDLAVHAEENALWHPFHGALNIKYMGGVKMVGDQYYGFIYIDHDKRKSLDLVDL